MTNTEISNADKIMLGDTEALAMYIGSTQIWQNTLPYDYEVEYLKSTGTQYIDTEIIPDEYTNILSTFKLTSTSYTTANGLFGCREESSSKSFLVLQYSNNNNNQVLRWDYGNNLTNVDLVSMNTNYQISTNGNTIYVNNGQGNFGGTFQNTTNSIYLFAINQNGQAIFKNTGLCCSRFVITKNNVTVLDLIPVVKNNAGYMYDRISKKLFGNAGNDSFIPGPDIISNTVPNNYTKLEYIESDGTQYIDTGVIPNSDTGISVTYSDDYSGTYDQYMIGCRNDSGDTRWCIGRSNAAGTYRGYGHFMDGAKNNVSSGIVELNYLNDKKFKFLSNNNDLLIEQNLPSSLSFTPINDIRLFGSKGTTGSYTTYSGRFKSIRISQGSYIIKNLVPCKNSNNIAGMYDTINKVFINSSSNSNFIAGPIASI